jgi:hypothetical protein
MKQHSIHSKMIQAVAERLGPLRPNVVFLGGSAAGFHITDSAEPEVRAKGDYLVSHDLEDIINLISGRVEIIEDIKNSEADIKKFIINSLQGFLDDELFLEALPGHLLPDQASQGRRSIILDRIKRIAELGSN